MFYLFIKFIEKKIHHYVYDSTMNRNRPEMFLFLLNLFGLFQSQDKINNELGPLRVLLIVSEFV